MVVTMLVLVLMFLLCLTVAMGVVGSVLVAAQRDGRELLTVRGEEVLAKVRTGTESAGSMTGTWWGRSPVAFERSRSAAVAKPPPLSRRR